MLVHKKTGGILYEKEEITASGGVIYTFNITFKDYPELSREDWWQIEDNSSLARKIKLCYPFFTPVTNDKNEIVDIIKDKQEKEEQNKKPKKRKRKW